MRCGLLGAYGAITSAILLRKGDLPVSYSIRRHPGIILGRLQRYGLVPYKNLRKLLSKVTPSLTI